MHASTTYSVHQTVEKDMLIAVNVQEEIDMFNEANSVENFIRDLLCGKRQASQKREVREHASPYVPEWHYIPRHPT